MDDQKQITLILTVILICIGLIFMIICLKFGLSVGNELGELIYNLKH